MTRKLICLLTLFLTCRVAKAQTTNDFICVGGMTFTVSDLVRRTGLLQPESFDIHFSVKAGRATKMTIDASDSAQFNVFRRLLFETTTLNFSRITFLKDTTNARLRLTYSSFDTKGLSQDYAQVTSRDEVKLVFRRKYFGYPDAESYREGPLPDTVILHETIFTQDSIVAPTNILIEKFFGYKLDSTVIRVNNNPLLTSKIYDVASRYDKLSFLGKEDPKPHWYFIRFKLGRHFPDCTDTILEY